MGRFFFQDCLMQCKNIDLKHSVQAKSKEQTQHTVADTERKHLLTLNAH